MTGNQIDGKLEENLRTMELVCDERMKAIGREVELRFQAMDKSVRIAADAMDRRLEGMNEFRGQLSDQANRFIPREEYCAAHERIVDDIRGLRESRAEIAGKASMGSVLIAYGLSAIGIIFAVIDLVKK
jgi:hypothetical protein